MLAASELPWRWWTNLLALVVYTPCALTVVAALWHFRHTPYVAKRAPGFKVLQSLYLTLTVVVLLLQDMLLLAGGTFPCPLVLLVSNFHAPLSIVPTLLCSACTVLLYFPNLRTARNKIIFRTRFQVGVTLAGVAVWAGVSAIQWVYWPQWSDWHGERTCFYMQDPRWYYSVAVYSPLLFITGKHLDRVDDVWGVSAENVTVKRGSLFEVVTLLLISCAYFGLFDRADFERTYFPLAFIRASFSVTTQYFIHFRIVLRRHSSMRELPHVDDLDDLVAGSSTNRGSSDADQVPPNPLTLVHQMTVGAAAESTHALCASPTLSFIVHCPPLFRLLCSYAQRALCSEVTLFLSDLERVKEWISLRCKTRPSSRSGGGVGGSGGGHHQRKATVSSAPFSAEESSLAAESALLPRVVVLLADEGVSERSSVLLWTLQLAWFLHGRFLRRGAVHELNLPAFLVARMSKLMGRAAALLGKHGVNAERHEADRASTLGLAPSVVQAAAVAARGKSKIVPLPAAAVAASRPKLQLTTLPSPTATSSPASPSGKAKPAPRMSWVSPAPAIAGAQTPGELIRELRSTGANASRLTEAERAAAVEAMLLLSRTWQARRKQAAVAAAGGAGEHSVSGTTKSLLPTSERPQFSLAGLLRPVWRLKLAEDDDDDEEHEHTTSPSQSYAPSAFASGMAASPVAAAARDSAASSCSYDAAGLTALLRDVLATLAEIEVETIRLCQTNLFDSFRSSKQYGRLWNEVRRKFAAKSTIALASPTASDDAVHPL